MNNLTTISRSGLDKIESSPIDYWYAYLRENKDPYFPSKETTFDIAFRCAVLQPDIFINKYVKIPVLNMKTNLGRAEYARIMDATAEVGHIVINENDYNDIIAMRSSLQQHPLFKTLLTQGHPDKGLDFEEEQSGVLVNFRPHWICESKPLLINLSSTKDATMDAVSKDMWMFKNHKKAAIHVDGMKTITGGSFGFLFIVVERTAPHKVNIFYPDERAMALGLETYRKNCSVFKECVDSGKWPGLDPEITAINLPNWAFKNQ